MRAIAAGLTDIGRERNHNEDRFILLPEFNVFVVADGMGGHQSGEVASRMAATTIALFFRAGPTDGGGANGSSGANGGGGSNGYSLSKAKHAPSAEVLRASVCDANAKIFARADDSRAHRGMGTTVVAAAYEQSEGNMHIAHAGDSRAYHIRGDEIRQMTRDHSLLSDALLERPELTEADLAYLPRNVITRALGIAPTVDVDINSCPAQPGDIFLLCSDGLHGLVDDATIRSIIGETEVLTDACGKLVEAANRNGGKDNITAVLIRIEGDDAPWSARSPGSIANEPMSQPPSTEPASTQPAPYAAGFGGESPVPSLFSGEVTLPSAAVHPIDPLAETAEKPVASSPLDAPPAREIPAPEPSSPEIDTSGRESSPSIDPDAPASTAAPKKKKKPRAPKA